MISNHAVEGNGINRTDAFTVNRDIFNLVAGIHNREVEGEVCAMFNRSVGNGLNPHTCVGISRQMVQVFGEDSHNFMICIK